MGKTGAKRALGIYHAPSRCPVCGGAVAFTRVNCGDCGTEMTGHFAPCRFCALEEKHLRFIETFLRCRGSIKDAERALGLSYPTVRGMLEAALAALGLDGDAPRRVSGDADGRESPALVLAKLESGEIDAETAIKRLKGVN